jgi:hypothetical protein
MEQGKDEKWHGGGVNDNPGRCWIGGLDFVGLIFPRQLEKRARKLLIFVPKLLMNLMITISCPEIV